MTPPERLRALLAEPGLVIMPAVWDGLTATMTIKAGFKTAFLSGSCVAASRLGGPDLDLIIELHRKLTPMVSIALAEALKPFHVFFLEDPIQIDSISTQAQIAAKSTVPFGNGERFVSIWEFRELLEQGGPQYLRPDVALAGGISHCKKIAAIGESYHCAVVTHNFLGPLITAASLHLDASIPNFITQEYTKGDEAPHNAVYKCSFAREGGYIPIPEAPGLGVELDRNRREKWAAADPVDKGRFLVRIRSAGGPVAYLRHDPEPQGSTDNLRFHDRLHLNGIPGRPASYANPLTTEFWDAEKDPDNFADIWERTADGPIWREE